MSEINCPRIEDEIQEFLQGDLQERALGFAFYLNEMKMTPKLWFGPTYWRVPYGENYLCGIVLNKDRFRFWFFKGNYNGTFEDEFTKTVWEHVKPCIDCGGDDPKGIDTTVFGKEFAYTCFQFPIQFENPDNDTLGHIKKLIEYWKGVVPPSDSWHARD
jgi:hypothetical protein